MAHWPSELPNSRPVQIMSIIRKRLYLFSSVMCQVSVQFTQGIKVKKWWVRAKGSAPTMTAASKCFTKIRWEFVVNLQTDKATKAKTYLSQQS